MILATILFILVESSGSKQRSDRRAGFTFRSPSSSSSSPKVLRTSKSPFVQGFASFGETSIVRFLPRSSTSRGSTDGNISSDQDILLSPTTTSSSMIESTPSQGDGLIENAEFRHDVEIEDDAYFDRLFDALTRHSSRIDKNKEKGPVKLVDFIEQTVGIKGPRNEDKKRRGRAKPRENGLVTSAFSLQGEERVLKIKGGIKNENEVRENIGSEDISEGSHQPPTSNSNQFTTQISDTLQPRPKTKPSHNPSNNRFDESHMSSTAATMEEQPPPSVNENREAPYNVVCTHITADFDTLASAIGLAKLWSLGIYDEGIDEEERGSVVHGPLPTYVVLPRGAHPDVQRFLSLHKHLFPIRSLKSLPGFSDSDMKKGCISDNPTEGLQRVGLVDAQRRDRLGPADILLPHAKLGVTIVDHHVDAESDIEEARHFVVEHVGSVSTMIAERLRNKGVEMTQAEATILALGIHSDTGSLVYDSTTPKDAIMLGWAMEMGASQTAIAEHAMPTLSAEQQGVLTQALININSTTHHGVTISTVLLSADGFIPGLATVTKDALDLSSSDVFLLAVCYEATRGDGGGGGKSKGKGNNNNTTQLSKDANERLQQAKRKTVKAIASRDAGLTEAPQLLPGVGVDLSVGSHMINSESWKGGEVAFQRQRLAATFAFYDTDRSGFLDKDEIFQALTAAGFLISPFVYFYNDMEEQRKLEALRADIHGKSPSTPSTMTIIGRVKAGVNVRNVNLNTLFQKFNGGGHPKAASATAKLEDESEAKRVLQGLVDELIDASLEQQLTVGDFMQSPVLSAKPSMTEKQVEDLFIRYDVRALPVVDDDNRVIGLVSYKEVAAAKMRLLNKQEKRMRQMEKAVAEGKTLPESRPLESALKGWMKQHVQTVEASQTMAEVENILLEADGELHICIDRLLVVLLLTANKTGSLSIVGCIPVVVDNTKQLIGMVTRTDLLRQHRYYSSLHYHNKGFSDSIAARKPIIELRKKLKKFDIENE
ncbi:hypothetical protein ACHAW5_005743 [Stephanodiscus triporus]|uniref:Calmodulin n=1 Tax=Stephanodiscus triporus TaxID=2934178 RepID=A0ABD3P5I0_9STRA